MNADQEFGPFAKCGNSQFPELFGAVGSSFVHETPKGLNGPAGPIVTLHAMEHGLSYGQAVAALTSADCGVGVGGAAAQGDLEIPVTAEMFNAGQAVILGGIYHDAADVYRPMAALAPNHTAPHIEVVNLTGRLQVASARIAALEAENTNLRAIAALAPDQTICIDHDGHTLAQRRIAILEAERDALRALAQKNANQECVYLRKITDLEAQVDAFIAAGTKPKTRPVPDHNPFRDFAVDRRRIGG